MKLWIALFVLCTLVAGAAAQAREPLAAFLERRVPEELAAEGVLLSRRGYALKLEEVGDKLIVSIVDATTGRITASTKIDAVPVDREAAVAAVTHVAADLATQVPAIAPPPPQAPAPQGLIDDREERKQHEVAMLRLQRQMIRFGADYELSVNRNGAFTTASLHRMWVTYQGELGQRLAPEQFYVEVGHPELADEYVHRGHVVIGGIVVGAVGFVGAVISMGAMATVRTDTSACSTSLPIDQFDACFAAAEARASDERSQYILPAVGFGAAMFVGAMVGVWYHYHQHPIDESEAMSLAQGYNDGLRRKLGLPTAARRVRDIRLAPVVASKDVGLVLTGRF